MRATFEAAAISELARRTLQSSEVTFEADGLYSEDIDSLSAKLGDVSPTLIIAVNQIKVNRNSICSEFPEPPNGRIGGREPTDDVIWIPGDIPDIWRRYLKVMLELAIAGYPGCVGCAGPAAELPWDESLSRRRLA